MTWTTTGEQLYDRGLAGRRGHCYAAGREIVQRAIDSLTWHPYGDGLSLPPLTGLAVQTLIRELGPRASPASRGTARSRSATTASAATAATASTASRPTTATAAPWS